MGKTNFLKEQIDNSQIQKVVRQLVIESEQKYKTLADNSLAAILIHCDDHIVYFNSTFQEMSGFDERDCERMTIYDIIHPDCREMAKERATKRMNGEDVISRYEIKVLIKSGEARDALIKCVRMMYGGKPAIMVNIIDITDLKNAQRENRELSTIVQTALIPIIKLDARGIILYANKSTEKFFQINLEVLKGKEFSCLLTGIEPEEMQEHIIQKSLKGGFDSNVLCRKADGAPVEMRLTTCPLIDNDNEMTAIACFLIDPEVQKTETNLLNADDTA